MTSDIQIGQPEIQRRAYCVEIDVADMLAITNAEHENLFDYHDKLVFRLEGDGTAKEAEVKYVHSVEYDGHFGAAIFYSVDDEDDTPELHEQVREIIRDQIEKARGLTAAPAAPSP
ncbi:hypothetical protein AYJ57_21450 (plasmid) [Salipiger sp. CCB-MM3]|uniref:hypothetical protein n=1 Tax=Salipiger sp. CCB-MM3 TaxID=1792508 RepID=UPI00080AAAEC|nr:hypothetical protein [Salipiger sp. CCB-MM3]ANT63042.1 hypothetical protein AYJ57_21450 [Salipiger sp. CCB-MM3]